MTTVPSLTLLITYMFIGYTENVKFGCRNFK